MERGGCIRPNKDERRNKEFKEGEWPQLLLLTSPWMRRDKMETLENEPDQ